VERQTGKTPQQLLESRDMPESLGYLWGWFWQLFSVRQQMTFTEIKNWAELTHTRVMSWEAETLRRIDQKYRLTHPEVIHV
jgi:hypothetical protein